MDQCRQPADHTGHSPKQQTPQGVANHHRDILGKRMASRPPGQGRPDRRPPHPVERRHQNKGGSKHIKHPFSLITAETVRKTARAFKPTTAIGIDAVTFREIASAPHQVLEEIAELFRQAVTSMTLPTQALLNIMATLGKEGRYQMYHHHGHLLQTPPGYTPPSHSRLGQAHRQPT